MGLRRRRKRRRSNKLKPTTFNFFGGQVARKLSAHLLAEPDDLAQIIVTIKEWMAVLKPFDALAEVRGVEGDPGRVVPGLALERLAAPFEFAQGVGAGVFDAGERG